MSQNGSHTMHLKNSIDVPSFASPNGELIAETIGHTAGGSVHHSVAQITLPPSKASRAHYHPQHEESYYILAGKGELHLGDEVQSVKVGDTILIPANMVHQIRNLATSRENLVFIAVCVPAWTVNCSVFLDE